MCGPRYPKWPTAATLDLEIQLVSLDNYNSFPMALRSLNTKGDICIMISSQKFLNKSTIIDSCNFLVFLDLQFLVSIFPSAFTKGCYDIPSQLNLMTFVLPSPHLLDFVYHLRSVLKRKETLFFYLL